MEDVPIRELCYFTLGVLLELGRVWNYKLQLAWPRSSEYDRIMADGLFLVLFSILFVKYLRISTTSKKPEKGGLLWHGVEVTCFMGVCLITCYFAG